MNQKNDNLLIRENLDLIQDLIISKNHNNNQKYIKIDTHQVEDKNYDSFVKINGRISRLHVLPQMIFIDLSNVYGKSQCFCHMENFTEKNFKKISKFIMGDIVEISGQVKDTARGKKSLSVNSIVLQSPCYRSIPKKHFGVKNKDLQQRDRCLNVIANEEKLLLQYMNIVRSVREFLQENQYEEVESSILQDVASGAMAKPFETYHEKLKKTFQLRIAPELMLKRYLICGYPRVFEIAKCFRNEGMSNRHLQEFTMLEAYRAYATYDELKAEVKNLLIRIIGNCQDLPKDIPKDKRICPESIKNISCITYSDLLKQYTNFTLEEIVEDENLMIRLCKKYKINYEIITAWEDRLEEIYKVAIRKNLTKPIMIDRYPIMPLAKQADKYTSYQFQILIHGKEIVKACVEENDMSNQLAKFNNQEEKKNTGEFIDTAPKDDSFIRDMSLGMPPACGFGIGINRLVQVLYNTETIRHTVFYPPMNK